MYQFQQDSETLDLKKKKVLTIGLIGRIGSGKKTFCDILHKKYQVIVIERNYLQMKDLANDAVRLKQEGKSRKAIQEDLMQKVIEQQENIFYQKEFDNVLTQWSSIQVISRICHIDEISYLLSKRSFFHFIGINTPILSRYSFFTQKYELDQEQFTLELFALLDEAISQAENMNSMITKAKVNISNSGTLEELAEEIKENINKIFRAFKPTWDEYFMKLAVEVKKRSSCCKRSVGAVLVSKENRILSTGYNGTPYGIKDCYDGGCKRCNSNIGQGQNLMECRCIHAEDNCILDVGVRQVRGMGGTVLYTTLFPCKWCAKVIVQSGISRLVFMEDFDSNTSGAIFKELMEEGTHSIEIVKQNLDNYFF